MSAPLTASVILVCMLCGMALGSYLRLVLPDDHTQADSKDILMTSAKGNYDNTTSGITQSGSKIITLDYYLSNYGPEAKEARELVRQANASGQTKARKGSIWRRWKQPLEWLKFTARFVSFRRRTTRKNIFKLRPCK
jgi:hypothetical protein